MTAGDATGSLSGRVALVTGGSSGIGLAAAQRLSDLGANVVVTHHHPDRTAAVDAVVADLESRAGGGDAVHLEVRDIAGIRPAVDGVAEKHGRLDILVNSAGTNVQQLAADVDEATWDLILDVNLKGTFFVCQAAHRVMAGIEPVGPAGHSIVNIASQMGLVGYARRAAYCASKAGVVNLTRVLAIEWAEAQVRVNAIAPTFIRTPLSAPMLDEGAFRDEVVSRSPMGKIGDPEDVAGGVAYLTSDAARLVTGHTLAIDGGWTAW